MTKSILTSDDNTIPPQGDVVVYDLLAKFQKPGFSMM